MNKERKFLSSVLFTAAITSSACARPQEADSKIPEQNPKPALFKNLPILDNPLSTPHVYYITGPHNVGRFQSGVKYAVDLAGIEVVPCKNNERKKLDTKVVSATSGTVTIAGGKDRFDNTWSIVEVDIGIGGFSIQYIHLDDIKVKVGDKVKIYDELGVISCEYPKNGGTDGIHLHIGIKKNGQPFPIHGLKMAGWEISEGSNHGDGTMVHKDPMFPWLEGQRVATPQRCNADTIQRCQGIRNDVFMANARSGAAGPTNKP